MPSLLSLRFNPPMEYNRDNSGGHDTNSPETQGIQQNSLHTVNATPETAQGQLPSLLSLRLKQSPTYPFSMPNSDVGSVNYTRQPSAKQPHEAFIAATIGQESGGDYNARSGKDKLGREAYGKYQIMDFNIPSWTKQFYGKSLTPEQYLADRQAQDAVGRGRLKELFDKYGVEDGASYYFSGGPLSKNANKKDKNGKTVASYVADIKRRFEQELAKGVGTQVASAAESVPQKESSPLPSLLSLRLNKPFSINSVLDDQTQAKALLKGAKDLLLGPRPKTYGEAKERGLIPLEAGAINLPPETPVPDNAKFLDAFGMVGSMNNVGKGLTTKLLERLKSATKSETVTKQFIEDLTNQADIKQPEKDLFRKILNDMSAQKADTSGPFGGGTFKVYHGSDAKNVRFNKDQPTFFTDNKEYAGRYGEHTHQTSIELKKPYRVDASKHEMGPDVEELAYDKKWVAERQAEGYDGMIIKDGDVTDYVVFSNKSIKPASPSIPKENNIHLPTFIDKVESELLPLKASTNENAKIPNAGARTRTAYENVTLPDELRGPVADYHERVYESPIKTSAGNVHFGNSSDNYFAHTRIEDLPDNKTRRVIEAQSDLFQKGRLEGEVNTGLQRNQKLEDEYERLNRRNRAIEGAENRSAYESELTENIQKMKELENKIRPEVEAFKEKRQKELSKLEPFRNSWHERIIREEVKQAAKDGKTTLQFPTGETAMKIEGLGDTQSWFGLVDGKYEKLTPERLKVGDEVAQGQWNQGQWIITDILGDGKFKAVPKSKLQENLRFALRSSSGEKRFHATKQYEEIVEQGRTPTKKELDDLLDTQVDTETFDISGKVDTNNPIYKFYNKEVRRYLTNKYGAKEIVDPQGVSWIEVNVPKDAAKMPIEAFGIGALPFITQNGDDNAKMK